MHRIKNCLDLVYTSSFCRRDSRHRHEYDDPNESSEPCLEPKEEEIDSKKKEFVQSFTVHGLSRIFTGSRAESIFWSTVVLVGIVISSFVIYGLVCKYYRYEIYTEVSAKVTNKNTFPSITFCDNNLMISNYFAYCGVPLGQARPDGSSVCKRKPEKPREIKNILKKSSN